MANTHEHLEHAEHAEHNSHDPFNQRVAVSMAIVAAILAAISMVGHRTHNKVLQLQGESNRLLGDVNRVLGEANRIGGESNRILGDVNRVVGDANRLGTEAASAEVEKSNLFAWYQAKRLRQAQYETSAVMLDLGGNGPPSKDADPDAKKRAADRAKAIADWKKKAAEYNVSNDKKDNLPDLIERGNEAGKRAEALRAEAAKVREQVAALRKQAAEKTAEADKWREEAPAFRKQAAEKTAEAEHVHHQADRFDIAHLSAELGLVLCSIALLTKKKAYWYTGLGAAALALALTLSGYMIAHHDPEVHEPPSQAVPNNKGNHN
jgi:hypothetical protein